MNVLSPRIRANIAMCAERRLRTEMIAQLRTAINSAEEYWFPGFGEALIENFKNPLHYYVSNDLTTIRVIDRNYAGTYADFRQGQMAAWGPNTATASREERAAVWTWGIYKPSREGMTLYGEFLDRFGDLPSYEEIIETRFRVWGEKVPYWYFLNYGTGDLAYPAFGGYNFVEKTRAQAPSIIAQCTEVAIREMEEDLKYVSTEVLEWRGVRTETVRVYGHNISVQRMEKGGTKWYTLVVDGKFRKGITPGFEITVGGRGTGFTFRE